MNAICIPPPRGRKQVAAVVADTCTNARDTLHEMRQPSSAAGRQDQAGSYGSRRRAKAGTQARELVLALLVTWEWGRHSLVVI
eukprot:scaffold1603_cov415-Prasinococcus_capsulatus_cf.AAC.17